MVLPSGGGVGWGTKGCAATPDRMLLGALSSSCMVELLLHSLAAITCSSTIMPTEKASVVPRPCTVVVQLMSSIALFRCSRE